MTLTVNSDYLLKHSQSYDLCNGNRWPRGMIERNYTQNYFSQGSVTLSVCVLWQTLAVTSWRTVNSFVKKRPVSQYTASTPIPSPPRVQRSALCTLLSRFLVYEHHPLLAWILNNVSKRYFTVFSSLVYLLKPSRITICPTCSLYLCVSYDSHRKQRLFP
jgi:hypothetical protein